MFRKYLWDERCMSDVNDACSCWQSGGKLAPVKKYSARLSDNFLWKLHITVLKSRHKYLRNIFRVVQAKEFLRINLGSCHCRNTFQLTFDGFNEEVSKEMPWNHQNKREKSQWDETWACCFGFKNGRQASRCAYDILLYEIMMRISHFNLYQRNERWTGSL